MAKTSSNHLQTMFFHFQFPILPMLLTTDLIVEKRIVRRDIGVANTVVAAARYLGSGALVSEHGTA